MSKGGFRPNSGRKKGSTPWNKGIPMSEESKQKVSDSKKGTPAWNKGLEQPDVSDRMRGNQNGKGNKGRRMSPEWIEKLRQAKLGKPSGRKGMKLSTTWKANLSKGRKEYLKKLNPSYDYRLDSKTREGNKRIRRERLRKFGGSHTKEQWESLKKTYNLSCPSCKRKEPEIKLTRDHIVSLSNSGKDDLENIQPLCVQCNSKKHTKTIKY